MEEIEADEEKEFLVIVLADTVVQPETVMVEASNALIAGSAVFCRCVGPFLADSAAVDFLGSRQSGSVHATVFSLLLRLLLLLSKLLEFGNLTFCLVASVRFSDVVGHFDYN